MDRNLSVGDIVQHFKRECLIEGGSLNDSDSRYLYKIIAFAIHTETKERFVVYQALYADEGNGVHFGVYCRPYEMFMSEVDCVKYPHVRQKYRFEKLSK